MVALPLLSVFQGPEVQQVAHTPGNLFTDIGAFPLPPPPALFLAPTSIWFPSPRDSDSPTSPVFIPTAPAVCHLGPGSLWQPANWSPSCWTKMLHKLLSALQLRQEIDGPQAEQLEFVPCGQILQNSRREES